MKLIVPFSTAKQPPLEQAGSKALALIEMIQTGMPVPSGIVLTVQFFKPWMDQIITMPEWEAVRRSKPEKLKITTRMLQARCAALSFTPDQLAELDQSMRVLQSETAADLFAVRSSSPEEDLDGASFAGGYESILGVTRQNIYSAIRKAFISSYDERVFIYKKEHGFAPQQPRIAVIVQQLVAADSAGVAFSLNPLNNCYDEAVINANFGLGESVVAGEVDPDVYVVDKISREILDTQIGRKEVAVTFNANGGTDRTTPVNSQQSSLTKDQITRLTDLLNQIESFYQKPVDIEWAIAHDKLHLLQVRPITTYLPLPEEMITPPGTPKYLYADSTLIEQGVQEPLSVLGADFFSYVLEKVSGTFGESITGIDGMTFTAGGRYYMNLSRSMKVMGRSGTLAPGSHGDQSVMRILDAIDLEPYLVRELPPKLAAFNRKKFLTMLPVFWPVVKTFLNPDKAIRNYLEHLPAQLQRFEQILDPNLSIRQQALNLTDLLPFFFVEYGPSMILTSQIAYSRIERIFKNETEDVREQLVSLGMSLPGNKTAEMGEKMFALATSETIQHHDSAAAFLTQLEQRTLNPEFLRAWDEFMQEYGARCPREIDVATPRLNEQPGRLFEQLKNMAQPSNGRMDGMTIFEAARSKREAAFDTLYQRAVKNGKGRAFKKYYKIWLTLGGFRETPKHYAIKVIDLFRQRVMEVAKSLAADGRLDKPEQIFDLTIDDIDRALTDHKLDLRTLAAERSALINKIKKSHLVPRIIDSRGKIFSPPRREAAEGELPGMSISVGVVRGRVKVLRQVDEKKLLPGEILVTRATDPGWTPLFINAGGIILEIGGALQHGAVVAREYGVPCVSGIDRVTEKLKDGQLVEVDGTQGIVRILEPEQVEISEPVHA
ncbi:MAG: PEP/pyruvate-binding domain-containing protein [Ardenticatenaceae bacterium]|nr:PEP/pyruvate-binding domain-containing protein [Ardenticatenaceae bacterium]